MSVSNSWLKSTSLTSTGFAVIAAGALAIGLTGCDPFGSNSERVAQTTHTRQSTDYSANTVITYERIGATGPHANPPRKVSEIWDTEGMEPVWLMAPLTMGTLDGSDTKADKAAFNQILEVVNRVPVTSEYDAKAQILLTERDHLRTLAAKFSDQEHDVRVSAQCLIVIIDQALGDHDAFTTDLAAVPKGGSTMMDTVGQARGDSNVSPLEYAGVLKKSKISCNVRKDGEIVTPEAVYQANENPERVTYRWSVYSRGMSKIPAK